MHTWAPVDLPRLEGSGPPLRLHDTSTGEIRATDPGPTALMYVCGITPYDATHLGHAATYLAFDLVNRYWRDLGHDVAYVQNITDIDDPLLERAARDHDDWVVLGMREIAELVGKLLAEGAAYRVDDPQYPDVYFDSAVTGHFGYESRYDEETMVRLSRERGGDPDRPGKRHQTDALLWRTAREGEPSWESDLGPGRPGWHVECAAHAEAHTGVHPFAKAYVHAGMIGLDGEKMSKSRGNLVFDSKLRASGVDPNAIRLALLAGHYRTDRPWTDELLTAAQARLARWREAVALDAGPDATDLV